jgi:transcriptional regulator with GAF, ATPase, and Fis domain
MNPGDTSPHPGNREQALAEVLVSLADTLVEDYDIVELLDRLIAACLELLHVSAAGLLLDDRLGQLAVMASSSEEARVVELFQIQNNEGPCLDCVRTGNIVVTGDLRDQRERWPLFAATALDAGFGSVAALPMRLRETTIGALNLFSPDSVGVSEHDQRLAQALADVATIGILQQRTVHQGGLLAEQLQHALNSRVVIEQAKGVIAERHSMSMDVAFNTIRGHARHFNLKLTDVAQSVVHGDLDLGATPDA